MLGGAGVVFGAEFVAVENGAHLHVKVGIGLGGGPDGEEQVHRVHRGHAPGGNPAVNHGGFGAHQFAQLGGQQTFNHRGAVQQFVGKYFRGVRTQRRQGHLVADVALNGGARISLGGDAVRGHQPIFQNARQQGAVELLLGAKVIVQVGLGQTRGFGNGGHGGATKACAGKHALGSDENQRLIGLADLAFGGLVCAGVWLAG